MSVASFIAIDTRHFLKYDKALLFNRKKTMANYTKEEIQKIASLARLEIKDSEITNHAKNFSNIINIVEKIKEINTENIEPMAHALDLYQRMRKDQVTETNERELLQKTAPKVADGLYLVPQVIE